MKFFQFLKAIFIFSYLQDFFEIYFTIPLKCFFLFFSGLQLLSVFSREGKIPFNSKIFIANEAEGCIKSELLLFVFKKIK